MATAKKILYNNESVLVDYAEKDSSGNKIVDTYATKEEVSDLTNIHNGVLTIQVNGATKGTFSADASEDVSINLQFPTDISELSNTAGYVWYSTNSVKTSATTLATAVGISANTLTWSEEITLPITGTSSASFVSKSLLYHVYSESKGFYILLTGVSKTYIKFKYINPTSKSFYILDSDLTVGGYTQIASLLLKGFFVK